MNSANPVPFFVYTVDNMQQLQLVIMGLVLVYLMHNRPEGILGHRKEAASPIGLERPAGTGSTGATPAAGDGSGSDEGETDE